MNTIIVSMWFWAIFAPLFWFGSLRYLFGSWKEIVTTQGFFYTLFAFIVMSLPMFVMYADLKGIQ